MTEPRKSGTTLPVWVVSADSESCDHYGIIGVFDHEPTESELKLLIHADRIGGDGWSDDECDGPGEFGSHLYLTTEKVADLTDLNKRTR